MERRRRRSRNPAKALRLLLDAVRARSEVSAVALVDTDGFVVAGSGLDHELAILGFVARRAADGAIDSECEALTDGTDVMAREVAGGSMILAALGSRVRRMADASRAVDRIVAAV